MIRILKFVKDNNNRWYVDLPEWTGDRSDLEMVLGADTLLDIMLYNYSDNSNHVTLTISDEYFNNSNSMFFDSYGFDGNKDVGGGTYYIKHINGFEFNLKIWLCYVTEFVFGYLPKMIYFK